MSVGGASVGGASVSGCGGRASKKSVVDAVGVSDTTVALEILSRCGLSEAPLWIRSVFGLSEGESFRLELARAIAGRVQGVADRVLLCDEFCSGLHRRLARAISFNLRKLVDRYGLCAVVACSQDDLRDDLNPDILVSMTDTGQVVVDVNGVTASREPKTTAVLYATIEAGKKRDYGLFKRFHYRGTDELGFVDKLFVVRSPDGSPLAIVVYSYAPLELALRNEATGGRFRGNPALVNQEIRILRRLVVHPDVRGCGIGHWLVSETLRQVGTPYVECLASMGDVNPVFEKSGMKRIGVCRQSKYVENAVSKLDALNTDGARSLESLIESDPRARRIIETAIRRWYKMISGDGEKRASKQSSAMLATLFRSLTSSRPVYYLWHRNPTEI